MSKKLYQSVAFANALVVAGMSNEDGVKGQSTVTTDMVRGILVYRDGETIIIQTKNHTLELPFNACRYMVPMAETPTKKVDAAARAA